MGELVPGQVVSAGGSVTMWAWWAALPAGLVGIGLLALGFWLIRAGGDRSRVGPTRLTGGVCGLLGGYHLVSWSLPASWLALRVPADRWWELALVFVAALAGSVLADVLERRAGA